MNGRTGSNPSQDILFRIAEKTVERIGLEKQSCPQKTLRRKAEAAAKSRQGFPFEEALHGPVLSFLCEVKKASPSKGVIAQAFPYLQIAREYEAAGADAISCLTEPFWFLGRDRYLSEIAAQVNIPVLRKDFTVDEYMLYQAGALGADAVLLICSLLDDARLRAYRELADELRLSALVEAHTPKEAERALRAGARIVGANNRNLKTFEVDVNNSLALRRLIPPSVLFVAESGIKTPEEVRLLREAGADAVLIGESLMRAEDKAAMLRRLKGANLFL